MKTIRKPDLRSLTSITAASGIVLATLVPTTALGDFGGSDTLAAQSAKWASFNGFGKPGTGKYLFQNSRLEFLVNSPTEPVKAENCYAEMEKHPQRCRVLAQSGGFGG